MNKDKFYLDGYFARKVEKGQFLYLLVGVVGIVSAIALLA